MVHETYLVKVGNLIASLLNISSGVQNVEDIFGIIFFHV